MSSPEFYVSANLSILIQVPTNKKDEMKRSRPCAHHEIPVDHQLSTLLGKDWQSILNLSNDITTKYTLLHHSHTETAQCFAKINIRCICGIPPRPVTMEKMVFGSFGNILTNPMLVPRPLLYVFEYAITYSRIVLGIN